MGKFDMETDKDCLVKDIIENQQIKGVFLVKEMNKSETRAGKPFLTVFLMDKSGEITGRVWDNAEKLEKMCAAGNIISIVAKSQSYKGNIQLNIQGVTQLQSQSIDWTRFMPSCPGDIKIMFLELKDIVARVEDVHIKSLLLSFLSDKSFVTQLKKAPAAKNMHHAYLGGLLEHTVGVGKLAESIASLYPEINKSLLIGGALLHDIGKIKEFTYDVPPFNYSDEGRLVGHMVLAIEMIQEKINQMKGFPDDLIVRLKHMILSHHGRYEFGSPSLPMMREAFVLNFIDDLDAKMNYMDKLSSQQDGADYQWSPYQRTLERFLYVKGHSEEPCSDAGPVEDSAERIPEKDSAKQRSLWEL